MSETPITRSRTLSVTRQSIYDLQLLCVSAHSFAERGEYALAFAMLQKAFTIKTMRVAKEKKREFLSKIWEAILAHFNQRTTQYAYACNEFRNRCLVRKQEAQYFDQTLQELQLMQQALSDSERSILDTHAFIHGLIVGEMGIGEEAVAVLVRCFSYQSTLF